MSYIVTARKWRPQIFEDVVGQEHVTKTLQNAITHNRIAHAYIFSGGRGCGKTTTARIFAKAVNCRYVENATPCNKCDICLEITENRSLDIVEIDGASNRGIDEIQKIREAVRYTPAKVKYRVYIIDEVHMLTTPAFNALLKTLEEPPSHIIFVFATTEIHKLPQTILSRCQRYNFKRISIKDISDKLKLIAKSEGIEIDEESLMIIAKKADGAMRDAQSIFDQVVAYCGVKISSAQLSEALNIIDEEYFFRVTDAIKIQDTVSALRLVQEIINTGYDIKEFLSGLTDHFRNLLIAKTSSPDLIESSEQTRNRYAADAKEFSEQDILRAIKIIEDVHISIRFASQPRFKLEVAIIQLTKMERSTSIDELLNELSELKKKILSSKTESKFSEPTKTSFSTSVIADLKPRFTITLAGTPQKEKQFVTQKPITQTQNISLETVKEKWLDFTGSIPKEKISLATILNESSPLKLENSNFTIGCFDEYHSSIILRNKEYLSEIFSKIFNAKVSIATEILESSETKIPPPKLEEPEKKSDTTHPVIDYLYKEFGAERV